MDHNLKLQSRSDLTRVNEIKSRQLALRLSQTVDRGDVFYEENPTSVETSDH